MSLCPDVCLSVCLSVCHTPSNCFFFFCFSWNRAIFGRQFSMWHSTKLFSMIFDLGPLTPKIYSPKFAQNRQKSACMADRPEMFGPTRGFSGMADSTEPCKMLWGPTLVAMTTKFGLGAEIKSPTGLSSCYSVYFLLYKNVKIKHLSCSTRRYSRRFLLRQSINNQQSIINHSYLSYRATSRIDTRQSKQINTDSNVRSRFKICRYLAKIWTKIWLTVQIDTLQAFYFFF